MSHSWNPITITRDDGLKVSYEYLIVGKRLKIRESGYAMTLSYEIDGEITIDEIVNKIITKMEIKNVS